MFVLASIKFFIVFRNTNVHESCIRSQNERFYHACNIFQKNPATGRKSRYGASDLTQKFGILTRKRNIFTKFMLDDKCNE